MNAESAEPPLTAASPPAQPGWSRQRWIVTVALVFMAHVFLVFLLGTKKTTLRRPVLRAPQFTLIAPGNELVALTDPTLFAVPDIDEFAPAAWAQPPNFNPPFFRWMEESPPYLEALNQPFGTELKAFLQTNRLTIGNLDFKPAATFIVPPAAMESVLPDHSMFKLTGDLARRSLRHPIVVPSLDYNDILKPSVVQVLVNAKGEVVSAVLLTSTEYEQADQLALKLSREAQFAPAAGLELGKIVFIWHTVPTTNSP